jgi:hypothetical protein
MTSPISRRVTPQSSAIIHIAILIASERARFLRSFCCRKFVRRRLVFVDRVVPVERVLAAMKVAIPTQWHDNQEEHSLPFLARKRPLLRVGKGAG